MSTAINTPIDDSDLQTKPWYRYGWPWFLISFPLISVLLGIMMVYLALTTNNALVVDDYYAEGKGINLRIERDRSASLLGLGATLTGTEEGLLLDLSRKMPALPEQLLAEATAMEAGFHWPTAMEMQWGSCHTGRARWRSDIAVHWRRSLSGCRCGNACVRHLPNTLAAH